MRRERGGDALNRFLATWEKLHSNSEATPTAPQTTTKRKRKKIKTSANKTEENQGVQRAQGGQGVQRGERGQGVQRGQRSQGAQRGERGQSTEEDAEDEGDIVEDFNFSSSDSDSD